MSHVGKHYDLEIDQRPMRIVLVGQEYGQTQQRVSLKERSERIALSGRKGFYGGNSRNPHMRGTTTMLRLLLGRDPGCDEEGEHLLDGHLFDGFALVNYLLCTALKEERTEKEDRGGAGKGYSSPTMRRNCGRHFLQTLEILEPTVIIAQGKDVRKWMANALTLPSNGSLNEIVMVSGKPVNLLTFVHPSAGGRYEFWGDSLHKPYLVETVAPTIKNFLLEMRRQSDFNI